jgi:colicin import membrane protein
LPDAQIAIEKAQQTAERQARARAEQDRAERERKALEDKRQKDLEAAKKREQQQLAEARARKADEERLDRQRQANLDRLMGQVGNAGGTAGGSAARDAGPSAAYAGRLVATIKPNIVFTDVVSGNPAAEVEVRAAPSGTILARRLVRSSGDKDWDEAVLRAIDRTGSLPRDTDGRVPPTIVIAFRPRE